MLLRGWIIPVGGTTPDRHKAGTLPLCWLRNADYQIPVRSIGQNLLLPVGNRAGRGLNPRPERSTPAKYLLKLSNARNDPPPAKYPPALPNSSTPPLPKLSHFPRLSNALAWMDHSGRGCNPRPAQGRPAQIGSGPTGTGGLLIKTPRRIFFAAIRGPSGAPSGPFGLQDLCAFRRLRRWPGCIFLKWRGIFRGSRRQR